MPDRRLPRSARLLTAADFQRVFRRPERSADAYFTVLAMPTRTAAAARLGLAVSKKQIRRAVDRNRLKRLVREAFRHYRAELAGRDLVVMARHPAARASNQDLRTSLRHHLCSMAKEPSPNRRAAAEPQSGRRGARVKHPG